MSSLNYFVLSSAGKPIFTRYPSSTTILTSASLTALLSFSEDSKVNLKSLIMEDGETMVVMRKGGIVLGAKGNATSGFTSVVCEFVYSQIVSTLTLKVQSIFRKSSKFDLRSMLTSTDSTIHGLLDKSDDYSDLMLCAVAAVNMDGKVRRECDRVLVEAASKTDGTVFAVVVSEGKLVSVVQPKSPELRIPSSDLLLLSNFTKVQKQTLMKNESWFPLCLPGFNAQGFLYCYCYCLHEAAGMFLCLISNVNTPEQFHNFQICRVAVSSALGMDGGGGEGDGKPEDGKAGGGGELVGKVLDSMEDTERKIVERYSGYAGVLHFAYRGDFEVPGGGVVSQCLSPLVGFPFGDDCERGRVWREYHHMVGGLRGGWREGVDGGGKEDDGTEFRTEGIDFLRRKVGGGRVEYKIMGTEIFVAVGGFGGEIYAVMPSCVGVEEGIRRVGRLGRRIWEDRKQLFVVNPPVFGS